MSDKKTYIRLAEYAISYTTGYSNWDDMRPLKFIKALRELVERCPDVTNEELKDLLEKAERGFCK